MITQPKKLRFLSREKGSVATEFVILLPIILIFLAGIVEGGHLWYVSHTITNASREGARAAVVYRTGDRRTWATNAAQAALLNYLEPGGTPILRHVTWKNRPGAVSFPEGVGTGLPLVVRVEMTEASLFLGLFFPDYYKNKPLAWETTMRQE